MWVHTAVVSVVEASDCRRLINDDFSGAPAAQRTTKRSSIPIWEAKGNP